MVGLLVSIEGDNPAGRVFLAVILSIRSISGVLFLSGLRDSPPGELPAFLREKNLK